MQPSRHSRVEEFIANPRRAVWIMAGPMIASFVVHSLYATLDAVFIGKLSANALAAVTYVGALFFVYIALANGLIIGISAAIATAMGRGDTEAADRIASSALGIGLIVGLSFSLLGGLAAERIIPWLGAEGEALSLAVDYFRALCLAVPVMFVGNALRAVLMGEGDAKTPMQILIGMALLTIALDPLFIFTAGLGIQGAAYALLCSQAAGVAALGYLVLVRRRSIARFRLRWLAPRWDTMRPILIVGLPASLEQIVMAIGMGLTSRVVAEFGQSAVAGYGAGGKVDMLVALPSIGLAAASVSVVGMFAGAARPELIRSTALYVYRFAVPISLILGLAAFAGSHWVISAFNHEPQVVAVGQGYLAYMVFVYPLMAFGIVSSRVLQGLGYGPAALAIMLVRVLGVAVPGAYFAVHALHAPIEAIWLAYLVGACCSTGLAIYFVRRFVWLRDPCALRSALPSTR